MVVDREESARCQGKSVIDQEESRVAETAFQDKSEVVQESIRVPRHCQARLGIVPELVPVVVVH